MSGHILRDYQERAVRDALEALRMGEKPLIVAPTGAGKTDISSALIRSYDRPTLFLAHRRELIQQAYERLKKYGIYSGIILAGKAPNEFRQVQVASVQTLARRPLPKVDLIYIDEAHHVTAKNTYGKLLEKYPNAKIIGTTATPWRMDGQGLGDVFTKIIETSTIKELTAKGYLVPFNGFRFKELDASGLRTYHGEYRDADLASLELPRQVLGDIVGQYIKHANGLKAVVFACSVAHSQQICDGFNANGVKAAHVDGKTPNHQREGYFRALERGAIQVLCNCMVAGEGVDIPSIECIILARPTASSALYLQQVGRGLRPFPGKTRLRIHDHARAVLTHGYPDLEREYSLEGVSPAPIEMFSCIHCGRYYRSKCPACDPKRCTRCDAILPDEQTQCIECKHEHKRDPIPELNTEVEAVELRSELAPKRIKWTEGMEMIGVLRAKQTTYTPFGVQPLYIFDGPEGPWETLAYAEIKNARLEIGDDLKLTFTGEQDFGEGKKVKRFRIQRRKK